MATTRVHCKQKPFDVYCGRPGPFGNPFRIGPDGNRDEVVRKHRKLLEDNPGLRARVTAELAGKTLGCWCRDNERCHCDNYIEVCDGPVLWRVSLRGACFGIEEEGGVVCRTAPIGRWMLGKSVKVVSAWVYHKGGRMEDVGKIIRVLAGVEPGRWWDIYARKTPDSMWPSNKIWLGVVEASSEDLAEEEALRQWWFLERGRFIFWERYSL